MFPLMKRSLKIIWFTNNLSIKKVESFTLLIIDIATTTTKGQKYFAKQDDTFALPITIA